jgi:hypothetical protein
MRWWRRLRDWLEAFDEYEWPDGVAWPEGTPTQRMPRLAPAAALGSVLLIGLVVALGELVHPFALAMAIGLVFGFLPYAVFLVWVTVREAKRQGWGNNRP